MAPETLECLRNEQCRGQERQNKNMNHIEGKLKQCCMTCPKAGSRIPRSQALVSSWRWHVFSSSPEEIQFNATFIYGALLCSGPAFLVREYRHECDISLALNLCWMGWGQGRLIHKQGKGWRQGWTKGQCTRQELKIEGHWQFPPNSAHALTQIAMFALHPANSHHLPAPPPFHQLPLNAKEIMYFVNQQQVRC